MTRRSVYGNDYIAGGAGEDEIFGQLGNDVIQGDGTIGVARAARDFADNLAAAQLSLTRADGSTVAITDFTHFGADRGAVPTNAADFGFSMDPSGDLTVQCQLRRRSRRRRLHRRQRRQRRDLRQPGPGRHHRRQLRPVRSGQPAEHSGRTAAT